MQRAAPLGCVVDAAPGRFLSHGRARLPESPRPCLLKAVGYRLSAVGQQWRHREWLASS